MKYVFVENHRAEFSIKAMCRVLHVARSGWYAWCQRRHQTNRRQQFRLVCDAAVRQAFSDAKQRYGAPRLAYELPWYNIKTIAASLRRQGLRAKAARKLRPVSYREHGLPVSAEPAEAGFLRQQAKLINGSEVSRLFVAIQILAISKSHRFFGFFKVKTS